jgi:rSAM/selenodomain-associated transferase 1
MRAAVLARYPLPGQCKTRLIPGFGEEGAAAIHRKLTEHTVEVMRSAQLPFTLYGTGADEADFRAWLGPLDFAPQPGGDLGDRLMAAGDPYPVFFFGTDCADLKPGHIAEARKAIGDHDVVIGPADDGGYWTLGLRRPRPELFRDMPWGTDRVFALTVQRAQGLGLSVHRLSVLSDVDRPEDAARYPWLLS